MLLTLLVVGVGITQIVPAVQAAESNNELNIPAPPESGPSMNNFSYNSNTTNPPVTTPYPNVQVVTKDTSQATSLWWKNKVNLSNSFTFRFYVYMASDNPDEAADGITFTLQNDDKGSKALGVSGESLGSYGNLRMDKYGSSSDKQPVLDYFKNSYHGGINNALSLEFDPYFNGDYSDADVLPTNGPYTTGAHMAFVLPDKDHLTMHNRTTSSFRPGIAHYTNTSDWFNNQPNGNSIYPAPGRNDGFGARATPNLVGTNSKGNSNSARWEPVVYHWNTTDGGNTGLATMTFGYPDSSKNTGGFKQQSFSSPKIDVNKQFGSKMVNWGMTASTGAKSMISAISASQIPGDPGVSKTAADLSKLSRDTDVRVSDKDGGTMVYGDENGKKPDDPSLSPDELMHAFPFDATYNDGKGGKGGTVYPVFRSQVNNARVGDILLYRADIYNYYDSNLNGNDWLNVHATDHLPDQLRLLDDSTDVDLYFDKIPPIHDPTPMSHGFKAALVSNQLDPGTTAISNTLVAKGSNFADTSVRSTVANVVPDQTNHGTPNLYINNQMQNVTQGSDWSTTLNDVRDNDEIKYRIPVRNISRQVNLDNSSYTFYLPSLKDNDPKNLKIKVDGQEISNDSKDSPHFTVSKDQNSDSKNAKQVTITGMGTLQQQTTKNIEADVILGANQGKTFKSTPKVTGTANDSSLAFAGNEETYNLKPGSLSIMPNSFDYGTYAYFKKNSAFAPYNTYTFDQDGKVIPTSPRINPGVRDYTAATIQDTRGTDERQPYRLTLSQAADNNNGLGNDQLKNADIIGSDGSPFQLVYYDKQDKPHFLSPGGNQNIPIFTSNKDTPNEQKVQWNNRTGLMMYVKDDVPAPTSGQRKTYGAALNWTVNNTGTP
ncbi:lectin-like domain-containing protein [Fructilactobacillus florum]|uniref:lectin-like domain-containing protein n=1 Tax=Fructilactobacillus florum TaxID=640331 RepID=UPI00028CB8A3|nr:hypothetical protein [Fructilactobacillus florum]EKK20467.1 hypothetical protein B807_737 [Fructilactobacillus florum 2F]